MTQEDVQDFMEMMTYFILLGIPPIGNKTTAHSWTFTNAFATSVIIVSTIGYGTVSPKTAGGRMFCVIFSAIGIPLTIIFFKTMSKFIFLPFEKLGKCLKKKGVSERNVFLWKILAFILSGSLLFLVLPPFVFMSLENWTYVEGIYFSFTTISAIGLGDYTIVSNPMKETQSITFAIAFLIWNLCGLVWIALLFNLMIKLLYEVELKLSKGTSEKEVRREVQYRKVKSFISFFHPNNRKF